MLAVLSVVRIFSKFLYKNGKEVRVHLVTWGLFLKERDVNDASKYTRNYTKLVYESH